MTAPADLAQQGMDAATNAADMRVRLLVDETIKLLNALGCEGVSDVEHRATCSCRGREWSANCARPLLPTASQGLVGARVKAASMRRPREMVAVGWVRSTLPSTHGKLIATWRGVA